MPKIKLISPDGSKMEFELTIDRATVGRAEGNDIVIPDGSVSSRHGEMILKGDSVELVDLGSTNGTHVDGKRVERATVAPGGTFKLGSVEGTILGEPSAAAPSSPAPSPSAPPRPAPPPSGSAAPSAPPPSGSAAPSAPPRPAPPSSGSAAPSAPPRPSPPPKLPSAPADEAVSEDSSEAEEPIESPAPSVRAPRGAAASSGAVISGIGATACPAHQRRGFGAKVKKKEQAASMLSALGVLSLLVCGGAVFLILTKLVP